MAELFADSYPARTETRCGMEVWTVIGTLALVIAVVLGVFAVWGRFGPHDPPG